jgi:hypothetical protein
LLKLGPLPGYEADPAEDEVNAYQELLGGIAPPVTEEEAKALVTLFGPDDCYGLAWTLLHLIESAPGWPVAEALQGDGEWVDRLRRRADNAGALE